MIAVWQYLINNLETITFCVSVIATILGAISLILVCFWWSWLKDYYREFWAKIVVAVFRFLSVVSAFAARMTPNKPNTSVIEQPWVTTILIAGLGYLFWEIAGAYGDHRYKLAKEKTNEEYQQEVEQAAQDYKDAVYELHRHRWLLTMLRESVAIKRERIRRVTVQSGDTRASISQARDGLGPKEQIHTLLEVLANHLRLQAIQQDTRRHGHNFRIGLVAESGGYLVPLAAFDLATKSHEPFSSYSKYAQRYQLDNHDNPSQAVRCIQESRMLIIADGTTEPDFYLHEQQGSYLRSLIAFPIANFCRDGVTVSPAAIIIDTNIVGFFNEDDRVSFELLLEEFVKRIDLEYAIIRLTSNETAVG